MTSFATVPWAYLAEETAANGEIAPGDQIPDLRS